VSERDIRNKLKALEDLAKHPGWLDLVSVMKREMYIAVCNLGQTPDISNEELHWRRGRVDAAAMVIDLPQRRIAQLTNELPMEAHANPAKAGE
jgi:hypothetical protein